MYDASGSQGTTTGRAPRDERLSRAVVVDAALVIARRDGLGALSMRRLADELGVSTMAAYRHVASKDTLVEDVLEAVVATIPLDAEGDTWQEQTLSLTLRSYRTFLDFPGIVEHLNGRALVRPAVVRWLEALTQPAATSGVTTDARIALAPSLVWQLRGATRLAADFPATLSALEAVAADGPEDVPTMRAGRADIADVQAEDLLRRGTQLLIDGLAQTGK